VHHATPSFVEKTANAVQVIIALPCTAVAYLGADVLGITAASLLRELVHVAWIIRVWLLQYQPAVRDDIGAGRGTSLQAIDYGVWAVGTQCRCTMLTDRSTRTKKPTPEVVEAPLLSSLSLLSLSLLSDLWYSIILVQTSLTCSVSHDEDCLNTRAPVFLSTA
jgi:hypothetical protein